MATALKIQGRKGRHELINCIYEPTGQQHNGKNVWGSHAAQPLYIFHTGSSRWVVSKRLDDGAQCYTFMKDDGNSTSPADVKGSWVCCSQENEWQPDPRVSCVPAVASNDQFATLRTSLDSELKSFGLDLNDAKSLKALWKRLDYDGSDVASLAEIEKMVVEMVTGGTWPAWLNNKPALMHAYKKTILKDGDGDDLVEKPEFNALLFNLVWFNKLFKVFNVMDGDGRRMDLNEFTRSLGTLGLNLNPSDAAAEFKKMDTNGGGQVLFVEFCAYIRNRVSPDSNPAFDGDIYAAEDVGKVLRKTHGHKVTHTHLVKKKSLSQFDDLEQKIKEVMADDSKVKELFSQIDANHNDIVSLAEIDKLVLDTYPLLNHKPALDCAYKATIQGGNGDDWVQKREFKLLLGNLFYFNKLFWLFDNSDASTDRSMDFQEFRSMLNICTAKMSEQEMRSDFSRVDKNGAGTILFDDFCKYFTAKACPQCLTQLVG